MQSSEPPRAWVTVVYYLKFILTLRVKNWEESKCTKMILSAGKYPTVCMGGKYVKTRRWLGPP